MQTTTQPLESHLLRRLLVAYFVIGAALSAAGVYGHLASGRELVDSVGRVPFGSPVTLADKSGSDSWLPLLEAHARVESDPGASPYDSFLSGGWKFQYPPIALAIAGAVPAGAAKSAREDWYESGLGRWNDWFLRVMLLLTIGLSSAVLVEAQRRLCGEHLAAGNERLLVGGVIVLGLFFAPIPIGYALGQFQLALDALAALGLLLFLRSRKLAAGLVIGLFCLIKPQLALVAPWALLRREYRLFAGMAAVGAAGLIASVALYGVDSLTGYLEVLNTLSRHGEAYRHNQGLAGVLHRFHDPATAIAITRLGSPLPPYVGWIHAASTAYGLALIGMALAIGRRSAGPAERLLDFCTVLTAATLASPVAWNHHFGVLFPVFAATAPLVWLVREKQPLLLPIWFLSGVGIGTAVQVPDPLFLSRWTGLLGSQMFVGGQLLLVALLMGRRVMRAPPERPVVIAAPVRESSPPSIMLPTREEGRP